MGKEYFDIQKEKKNHYWPERSLAEVYEFGFEQGAERAIASLSPAPDEKTRRLVEAATGVCGMYARMFADQQTNEFGQLIGGLSLAVGAFDSEHANSAAESHVDSKPPPADTRVWFRIIPESYQSDTADIRKESGLKYVKVVPASRLTEVERRLSKAIEWIKLSPARETPEFKKALAELEAP